MLRYLLTLFLLTAMPLTHAATTFKIASLAPDGTSWMKEMRAGAEEINKRTDGRVEFRFYPGGIMGNDKSVLRKMRVGQLHGGALTGGGLAMIYPDAQVYTIPFIFHNYAEVDYARRLMDPVLLTGMKERGYVSFGISEGGFAYLMSKSPVGGIDDLKGLKVWVPEGDEISRAAFEASGVSPISLPLTDVLTALQTGLIDTVASSAMGAIALQWHTRVKHLTDSPLMYLYGSMVVSAKQFEKLSAEDQQIVHQVMSGVFERLDHLNRNDNQSAMAALQQQGIGFVTPDETETQRWRASLDSAMQRLLQQGLFDPAILKQLQDHLQEFRQRKTAP
ncbi:MAG: TRAP transporter substrate-binding protein DctP [Gammaproteobacteria bacterium]|nr:TRAP transporter substrate-binding protein DctP [Gammaproteobacteria bacterium]